jgi:predicted nucleotidyltransferase component of viral defense system
LATLTQYLRNILEQKGAQLSNETRRIVLKEALQAYTLDFIYNHQQYRKLNFYGGTCLHVIYGLNRLSEDLDLDNGSGVEISGLEYDLLAYFRKGVGYQPATVRSQVGTGGIQRITLKFPILAELGLTTDPSEALHLKVEISPQTQVAEIRKTPVLVYGHSFVAQHFSLETMMAGKMLACLERNFQKGRSGVSIKGRDFYDLLWFMQKEVQPNVEKLGRDGKEPYTPEQAMQALDEKVAGIRVADLALDLLPLFEQRSFIEAWLDSFHENFRAYRAYYGVSE